MARHGRRIKRCGTCVERKVKCDEQQPHCQRCINAGLACSGYHSQLKFVDEGTRFVSVVVPSRPKPKQCNRIVVSARCTKDLSPQLLKPQIRTLLPPKETLFLPYTLSKLSPTSFRYDPALVTGVLPALLTEHKSPLHQSCIHALSAMYFGRIHQDKQACNQGLRLYSYALTQLRSEINSSSTDMGTIMGVMCLCVYENVVFSQPTAWLLHYDGLGRLLHSRGPKPLETEAERQIWRVARYFIILSAGHQRKRVFLEQPQWVSTRCMPRGETPEKFDLLLDMFAQFPGIIEDYDRLRKSTFIDPGTREAFRQRLQSLINGIHAWLRDMPWICTPDPTLRETSQGQLPDDPMDCASLAVCYAILLCLIQPCDCLRINIIPEHNHYNVDPARVEFLTQEICRFSKWALRGGDSANLALLLIYPLQIAWFFLQKTPEKLDPVRKNLDLAIADSHGFELGRMREWNELNLEQGRYGFMYK
ncbi:hypothetical protein FLAG1_08910 [Fusarium langsethiae]|uniref:Zn(2)-C6 fungal-type domain-containing protein n=1 Tax=Fusarium langsethiae TaxID=179993 RepID=A0A0M9ERP9_FUSLA|nr:hypothetical protein FLAG1_08910 [Fusarium langsethiae]GKU09719.1 unnamed protein product [Fusarium langsethiae]